MIIAFNDKSLNEVQTDAAINTFITGASSDVSKCAATSLFAASAFYRHVSRILAKSHDHF
jgi:hypothetical protein